MTTALINLLDLNPKQLINYCEELGEKPFRAKQLQQWIYQYGVIDFTKMTNLTESFRKKLISFAIVNPPTIISDLISIDGTRKWLVNIGNNNAIETIFIPEKNRGTLCISTQIGCAINCCFCFTGKQGFNRNLSVSEIIGQLWIAELKLRKTKGIPLGPNGERQISNVVMMGMGEPFLNFKSTVSALKLMLDNNSYGLSRRHIIISTSGVVPMIHKLSQECPVVLAVSLHAPNDNLRNQLIPLNKKYPLNELIAACKHYLIFSPRNFITFEYCMLDGVNDTNAHAHELISLIYENNMQCKFNLIPFNSFPQSNFKCSNEERIKEFRHILINSGIVTTIRKTRGNDINAACGQLAGKVQDRKKIHHYIF